MTSVILTASLPAAALLDTFNEKLHEYSELHGDCNNDGRLTPADACAILKDIVEIKAAENPAKRDFDLDGIVTAKDASALLKKLVEWFQKSRSHFGSGNYFSLLA